MRIGVLALQGAFRAHRRRFAELDVDTCDVRLPRDLAAVDGLVMPGGETHDDVGALDIERAVR